MCLMASSSGRTQFCHSGDPYDMHPRMILETFKPEFPSRTAGHREVDAKHVHVQNNVCQSIPYCIFGTILDVESTGVLCVVCDTCGYGWGRSERDLPSSIPLLNMSTGRRCDPLPAARGRLPTCGKNEHMTPPPKRRMRHRAESGAYAGAAFRRRGLIPRHRRLCSGTRRPTIGPSASLELGSSSRSSLPANLAGPLCISTCTRCSDVAAILAERRFFQVKHVVSSLLSCTSKHLHRATSQNQHLGVASLVSCDTRTKECLWGCFCTYSFVANSR